MHTAPQTPQNEMVLHPNEIKERDQRTRWRYPCCFEVQSLIPQSLCQARLDSDLTHLVLHVPHAQHPVALRHRASDM